MNLRYIGFSLFFPYLFLAWAIKGDFDVAKKAYDEGRYKIAEVYFDNFLKEEPPSKYITDAVYYLIKIYDSRGDFIKMLSCANRFLNNYKYDNRCNEVLSLLLKRLNEKEAFSVAVDYIENYDYLINDYMIIEKVGYGLFKQDRKMRADYIFSLCSQTDTIKIMRAVITSDFSKKREIYESIAGLKGRIYLMEFLLEIGDTLESYEAYRLISGKDVKEDVLYRYTKISMLFDKSEFSRLTKQLRRLDGFKNKALLLEALNSGYLEELIIPSDQEECVLLIEYLRQDTVSRSPPDSLDIDLSISDSLAEDIIISIKEKIGGSYYLDSAYSEILLHNDRIDEAYGVIAPYLKYLNTIDYVRKIRALKYYNEGKYDLAAKDIILSHASENRMKLFLANSLKNIGKNSTYLYKEVMKMSQDTLLSSYAVKKLIKINFENRKYNDVIKHKFDVIHDDTSLVQIYIYSLARMGKKGKADSIFSQYFVEQDYNYVNYYGEYLIDKKKYKKAEEYYDSIIHLVDSSLLSRIYYNWAIIPFLQGKIDTALSRFIYYVDNLQGGEEYYKAIFKIATINYLKQEFDTAAHYYGIASEDDSLHYDAIQNQLICYKKSGNWYQAVETGKKILPFVSGDGESDIRFEIGYAYLRAGDVRDAVEYLRMAASIKSSPEFFYWLGEAYLAKGDFIRALYQYQKIVELFPEDKMWTPTAHYKIGIVFEFMDELDEAKKVYKMIIKKRGIGDTWGIEAQKRLEEIEQK